MLSLTQALKWILWIKTCGSIASPYDVYNENCHARCRRHLTLWWSMWQLNFDLRNLVMTSNFWVGNVPFPLLCGRPWQVETSQCRRRKTGTWLVHRDNFDSKLWRYVLYHPNVPWMVTPWVFFGRAQPYHKTTKKKSRQRHLTSAIDDVPEQH